MCEGTVLRMETGSWGREPQGACVERWPARPSGGPGAHGPSAELAAAGNTWVSQQHLVNVGRDYLCGFFCNLVSF